MSQDISHHVIKKKKKIPAFSAISQNQEYTQEDHRKTEAKVRNTTWVLPGPLVGRRLGQNRNEEYSTTLLYYSVHVAELPGVLGCLSFLTGNIA